jgi:hypothetical protein
MTGLGDLKDRIAVALTSPLYRLSTVEEPLQQPVFDAHDRAVSASISAFICNFKFCSLGRSTPHAGAA